MEQITSQPTDHMHLIEAYSVIGKHYSPGCVSWYEKQGPANPWTAAQNKLEAEMAKALTEKRNPHGPWVKQYALECAKLCDIYKTLVSSPLIDGKDATMFGFMYADGDKRYTELERTQAGQCVECESTDSVRLKNKTGRVLIYCGECADL